MLTIGSLFSGIGGLELGLEMLGLGPVVWQAECDPYRRAVLTRHWPHAVRIPRVEEIQAHVPRVTIVCGGFPCQDISIAGGRAGLDGHRSGLWYEFARVIRLLRPPVVFVENVPELAAELGRVLGPLAEYGYDAEWGLFSAAEAGAPHRRERMFILAHADGERALQPLADAWRERQAVAAGHGLARVVADADCARQLQSQGREQGQRGRSGDRSPSKLPDAARERLQGWANEVPRPRPWAASPRRHPWAAEPDVGRVAHGLPALLDRRVRAARLRCLGDAVVPQQAAHAFLSLARRAGLIGQEAAC